jgi:hypothetical protein
VSEQHEEEILRRWTREQAEIERQTDALVLKALTAMVTAAEDLKSKLRRDVESILEEYRRVKRGLENEISLATAERQRFRREVEQERDSMISQAEARAREIITSAERERDALLSEATSREQRLRTLEEQIRSVFGIEIAPAEAEEDDDKPAPATVAAQPAAAQAEPETSGGFVPASVASLTSRGGPFGGTAARPAPPPEPAPAAPPTRPAPAPSPVPGPAFADDDDDEGSGVAAAQAASAPAPAPQPTGPRQVELVFEGVPGYQQASALEMAVGDLLPDGDVDIVEFEHGQLVLSATAADLDAVAEQLVASMPASLQLADVSGDRATFHCV